jgi:hypothetical protein
MAKRVRPQRGDGVAVEVPHQRVKVTEVVPMAELARVGRFQGVVARKLVHQAPVPRSLLGGVVVVLVARVRLATIDPERVGGVRIVHQQGLGEPVHRRRARTRPERRLPGWVGRHGIGAEVGVERVVLLEDHDHVLDPCSRRDGARSGRGWPAVEHQEYAGRDHRTDPPRGDHGWARCGGNALEFNWGAARNPESGGEAVQVTTVASIPITECGRPTESGSRSRMRSEVRSPSKCP